MAFRSSVGTFCVASSQANAVELAISRDTAPVVTALDTRMRPISARVSSR
jgi:hypothetical protein